MPEIRPAEGSRFVHPHEDRLLRSYAPSFFDGTSTPFLSPEHQGAEAAVAHIRGKLEPADHLKLYEAGYFARGDVLEIGRLHAKSTVVLAMGLRAADHGHALVSIEYEARYEAIGREHLESFGLAGGVELLQGDSSQVVTSLDSRTFDMVFVDGDHTYEGVKKDIAALAGRLTDDAVVMFHDYFHPANAEGSYGVARAVDEHAGNLGLRFRGRFGGIAMYGRSA